MSWTNNFLRISPSNEALLFLDKRIRDECYRGRHTSQHNRFDLHTVNTILEILNKIAPNNARIQIRTTDLSKRPELNPGEEKYASFCEEVNKKIRRVTQDSMRKNFFPDFHRMKLIKRYNKNNQEIGPYKRSSVMYISLSDLGIKLIEANMLNRYFLYSKGLDNLFEGKIEMILTMLRNEDFDLKYIDMHEYLFFISAIDTGMSFSIDIEKAINLIKEYRHLSRTQKVAVHNTLNSDLHPNPKHPKNEQRDYHNWYNKTQQVYHLLKQTVYFDVVDNKLLLSEGKSSKHAGTFKLLRSRREKREYFRKHKVSKKRGFEMHHVVPLASSESQDHFKLLDKWQNMTYIDAFSHAKVTQNGNRNIILENNEDNLLLKDYVGNNVYLKNQENILYDTANQQLMLDYNREMRET